MAVQYDEKPIPGLSRALVRSISSKDPTFKQTYRLAVRQIMDDSRAVQRAQPELGPAMNWRQAGNMVCIIAGLAWEELAAKAGQNYDASPEHALRLTVKTLADKRKNPAPS